jgi:hypothetical protein
MIHISCYLLSVISDISRQFICAINIRKDGLCLPRTSTASVYIMPMVGHPGFDISIWPGTPETVYFPACVPNTCVHYLFYGDFCLRDHSYVIVFTGCSVDVDGEEACSLCPFGLVDIDFITWVPSEPKPVSLSNSCTMPIIRSNCYSAIRYSK